MNRTDPKPFYDAALTGANGAAFILRDYPVLWRTIAVRYPWRPGERDDYITHLCKFDHAAFTS